MLHADSFVFRLIGTLSGLEKDVRTPKRDLAVCEKANTNLQKGREAVEAREDATEGNTTWSAKRAKVWSGNHIVFLWNELAWS